jgi:exopolyphosphatase/guanosine-5'-triphosphate,3'-diphosphate pyrophosphatase
LPLNLTSCMPSEFKNQSASPYFAAIDLGSNSFHLLIVSVNNGVLETVDRVKEMVQIAIGLRQNHSLSEEAQARALHCLSCFQERIRDIPPEQVRVVGTKALRRAENAGQFIREAEAALGHSIDIISGYEEARLIYLGVAHDISKDKGRPLIIDIGGGSTEFIIGAQNNTLMESLSIGCVTYSDRFFTHRENRTAQPINNKQINEAYYATCLELEIITQRYRRRGWDIVAGSSGTMRAIADLMPKDVISGVITRDGLDILVGHLRQGNSISEVSGADDISNRRLNVLPAGIVILKAIFDQLQLDEIHVVNTTLKEGLIYDTLGRLSARDMRDKTVEKMMEQYQVDKTQAARVNQTLQKFIRGLATPIASGVDIEKALRWAALLHEIGLSISHSGYHHHGAYLLQHSDLAGFSRFEQELMAIFIGSHRRKIRSSRLVALAETQKYLAAYFACFRLAILLNRRREDNVALPEVTLDHRLVTLQFADGWLEEHPLTYRTLVEERQYLTPLNIQLDFFSIISDD